MAHQEYHNKSTESLRDFILGMSDGLTVPFALAAGLSGALDNNSLIVVAGLAEIAAGSIAMGLGGYMAAKAEAEHYTAEYKREQREIIELPEMETKEVSDILLEFGLPKDKVPDVVEAIKSNPERWINFMMKFELQLEKPNFDRIYKSPLIIGSAYIVGGLIPLTPYMLTHSTYEAFLGSIALTSIALFSFGAFKARFTGAKKMKGALQTMLIGGLAATCAFLVASFFGG